MICRSALLVVSVMLLHPLPAAAQDVPRGNGDGRGSAGLVGGISTGRRNTGAAVGGTFAWPIAGRLSVEGRGVYLDRGPGSDALEVTANLLVDVMTNRRAIPYVAFGGGLYRASFDLDHPRYFGIMGPLAPGTQIVPTAGGWGMVGGPTNQQRGNHWMMGDFMWNTRPWTAPQYRASEMPMFYANRLGAMVAPMNGEWGRRSFVDPSVSFGGGVRLDLTSTLYLRPDVRTLLVVADGDTFSVTSIAIGVGYRF